MFALKSVYWRGKVRRQTQMPVEIGRPGSAPENSGSQGMVLPRFMRRPARLASKFLSDGADAPRYAATLMTISLLAAAGLYGAYLGGHMPNAVQAVTARTGFAIEEIKISGHRNTSEIDILGALELDGWTSLLGFSAEAARMRIAALPWIDVVSVRKTYPSTLEIKIAERQPFAIWQNGSKLALIERDGNVIVDYPGNRFAALPLIVGLGAPERAAQIVSKIFAHPRLATRVKAYIRVADRRWDLRLDNDITLKLPATGEAQAIQDLVNIDRAEALLSRDINAVDMRLADRMIVRLTPNALKARRAALKAEERARRREKKT